MSVTVQRVPQAYSGARVPPLPVLTSVGRGSDVMVPMAIPSFGGMLIEVVTMLVVPVLFCWIKEIKLEPAGTRGSPPPL